jgi:hypothetical protein
MTPQRTLSLRPTLKLKLTSDSDERRLIGQVAAISFLNFLQY